MPMYITLSPISIISCLSSKMEIWHSLADVMMSWYKLSCQSFTGLSIVQVKQTDVCLLTAWTFQGDEIVRAIRRFKMLEANLMHGDKPFKGCKRVKISTFTGTGHSLPQRAWASMQRRYSCENMMGSLRRRYLAQALNPNLNQLPIAKLAASPTQKPLEKPLW